MHTSLKLMEFLILSTMDIYLCDRLLSSSRINNIGKTIFVNGYILMSDINSRIRAFRKEQKMTQIQFSQLTGASQSYLSEVENGKGKPSLDLIIGMAICFKDLSLRWLLTGESKEASPEQTFDEKVLKDVIEVVEWALEEVGANPDPNKKATLISAVYDFYQDEGLPEDKDKLLKLVKAVA